MAVKFDFSDVDGFFQQGYAEVKAVEEKVGKEAVDYAVKMAVTRTGPERSASQTSIQFRTTGWS